MSSRGRRPGAGRIYKRGKNIWWISYSYRGKPRYETSRSTRKTDAEALLKKRLGEIGQGRLIGPDAEKVTLADLSKGLLNDYRMNGHRSIRRAEISMQNLKAHFGEDTAALDITYAKVVEYIDARMAAGASRGTVAKELAGLKRAFRIAVEAQMLTHCPTFPKLKPSTPREGFLERNEFEAVLEHLPDWLRAPLRFALLTGWRFASEVLTLKWEQVDLESKVVRLEPGKTKNEEGRSFPFSDYPDLEQLLRDQRHHLPKSPYVFHHKGDQIRTYRRRWQAACKKAGLDGAIVHDLRRTAVRNMVRAGIPQVYAMKLSGHKTDSIFRRYAISDEVALAEQTAKLAGLSNNLATGTDGKVLPISRQTDGHSRPKGQPR